jgi:hypothetical protein
MDVALICFREEGDGEKKTPKKFNRNTSAPYRKPVGGRGARR